MSKKLIIVVFIIFLSCPTLSWPLIKNYVDSENHEKRTYTEFPRPGQVSLEDFPGQIEQYFMDRIPYKNQIKRLSSMWDIKKTKGLPFGINDSALFQYTVNLPNVIIGVEDWMFYMPRADGEDSVSDYFGTNLYNDDELEMLAQKYSAVQEYFRNNDQEFVLMVIPGKEHVYSEYMPQDIQFAGTQPKRVEEAVQYLKEHTDVNIVYLQQAFEKQKNNSTLYYKYDSHWNILGAHLGVQELNKSLKNSNTKDLGNLTITSSKRSGGDLVNLIGGLHDYNDDTEYSIIYPDDFQYKQIETDGNDTYYRFRSNSEDSRKILLLGDSFRSAMLNVLPVYYKETIITSDTDKAKQILNSEDVDIVVLEITERYSKRFENQAYELISDLKASNTQTK